METGLPPMVRAENAVPSIDTVPARGAVSPPAVRGRRAIRKACCRAVGSLPSVAAISGESSACRFRGKGKRAAART